MQVMSSESSRTTANTGSRMMLSGEVVGQISGESVWVDSRSHSVVYIHMYTDNLVGCFNLAIYQI